MRAKVHQLSMIIINKYALIIQLYTHIIKTGSFQGKNLEFGVFETNTTKFNFDYGGSFSGTKTQEILELVRPDPRQSSYPLDLAIFWCCVFVDVMTREQKVNLIDFLRKTSASFKSCQTTIVHKSKQLPQLQR
jgi:hypothetical protein